MSTPPVQPFSARLRSLFAGFVLFGLTAGAVGVPFNPALAADATTSASAVEPCTTYFENASGDGAWRTPANWSTGVLPTDQDVACVIDEVVAVDSYTPVKQLHGNGTVVLNHGSLLALEQVSNILNVEVRDGTLSIGERLAPYSFIQQGGTVTGAGRLEVDGVFSWSGGTQTDEEGSTLVDSDVAATIVPVVDLAWTGRRLQFDGVAEFVGPGNVDFGGSSVFMEGASFSGGHVRVAGSQVTVVDGSVTSGAFLPAGTNIVGAWEVGPDALLGLTGGTITGTVTLDEYAVLAILPAAPGAGGTTIAAAGAVLDGGTGGVTVDLNAELTVAGTLFVDDLENNGTTSIGVSAVADTVTNDGWLDIAGEAILTSTDISINTGEVTVASAATIQLGAAPLRLLDGELVLDGMIMGSLAQSGGALVVDGAFGAAVRGDYDQTGGALDVILGDNVPLVVENVATVGGTLSVDAANPRHATEPLLIAGSLSGTFTGFTHSGPICAELATEADRVILESVYCPVVPQVEASEHDGLTTFSVSIEAAIDEPYSFEYHTVDGTAVDGQDYVASSGTAVIPAGDTSVGVEVEILDDEVVENDEDFGFIVSGPNTGAGAIAGATIVDDDDRVGYDDHFRIDDMGSMGNGLYPTGINSKGIVGHGSWDADNGFSWVWSFAARQRGYVTGFETQPVHDVAENGRILGSGAIREVGGATTPLARPAGMVSFQAAAMNDGGVVAGVGYPNQQSDVLVRWSTPTTPLVLDAPTASMYRVAAINNSGVIVGSVLLEGGTSFQPFRYDETGFHILDEPVAGKGGFVSAINEAGVAVGYANRRAIQWDADGNFTDLGPGFASGINNDGVVVGSTYDPDAEFPTNTAAIFFEGVMFEIGDYVPDDSGYTFSEAVEINDDGVLAVTGTYYGSKRTLVLTPFDCFVCVTTRFDEPDVDAPANYIPVDGATTDGNPVRLEVELTNTANSSVPVEVWVLDTLTDEPIHDEPYVFSLAGGGGRESVNFDIDTTGMAWSNGTPADPRRYEVIVYEAESEIDIVTEVASLTVNPRPMVMVHGLWSDEITWADYQAFAQNAHPAWKAYAVDTLDTSSIIPNTIAENAALVDAFVDQLRSTQNIWSVDLVGHSMGGLISRQYIQDLMPTYQVPGTTDGDRPAVDRLVMLGTPNGGSPCPLLAPLPATVELRPDAVTLFNTRVTERRGVDFSVAAGYHLPFTCTAPLPGDDVVPLLSAALGMEDVVEIDDMPHTSMTGSHDLFTQFVLPRLNGTSIGVAASSFTGPVATDEVSATSAASVETAAVGSDLQALFVDNVTVAPESRDNYGITVPVEALTVGVTLAASGMVRAELVDPLGVVRASIATVSGEYPSFRSMSAPAMPGRWILRVINTGTEWEEVAVGASATGIPVVLQATATQNHWSGRVQLTATLQRAAAQRPSELVGTLRDGTGGERIVALVDNGLSGDGAANDGTYGVVARNVDAGPALFTLNVVQTGFMRSATAAVIVAPIPDVPPPNTPPVANDLTITVEQDTTLQIRFIGDDAENDELVVTSVGAPTHGTITGVLPNIAYTPAPGYLGPDSFTYVMSDGQTTSAPGTVMIDVVPSTNTAPVATDQSVAVARDIAQTIVLAGTDVDNDELTVTDVSSPSHGTVSGVVPNVVYTPHAGYVGPDSFTFVMSDGQATSAPGTVTIDVGGPAKVSVRYAEPLPATAGRGEEVSIRAQVTDSKGMPVADMPVTFTMGGRVWVSAFNTNSAGFAGVTKTIDLAAGVYELRITTPATAEHQAGEVVTSFTVTANEPPSVGLGLIRGTEAGYRTGVTFGTSDPENDIVSAEWDMNGDGVVDTTTGPPENFGARRVGVVYTYPAPYEGPVTVTLIDSAGNRSSGSVQVDIAPYEPLGSLSMISAGDIGVRAIGMDDSARAVLHRVRVPGSSPTRYRLAVVDRHTGENQVVSIGVDGKVLDAEIGVMSADGNVVAFMGSVAGSNISQAFVRDLTSGVTTIASVDAKGALGNGRSIPVALSNDGSRLLFTTEATNFGGLACAGCDAAYVWEGDGGALTLVSIDAGGRLIEAQSGSGDISADGTVATFVQMSAGSRSTVVVRDLDMGVSTVASVSLDGLPSTGGGPLLNADGSVVVFSSSANDLFANDTNGFSDVVVRDLDAQVTRPVSSMLVPADGSSSGADISGDGTRVVFGSNADALTGTRTALRGVYVADLATNTVTLISREPRRNLPADGTSAVDAAPGWMTCDGRFALFNSEANNLVPGDVVDIPDSFVEDTGVTRPCSTSGNTAPTAEGQQVTTDEDTAIAIDLVATDADGDALTYEMIDAPDHGALSGVAPALTYTPAANSHGPDRFSFRVFDGTVWSEPATVNIDVSPVNDAPLADVVVPEWIGEGSSGSLVATAADVDGDSLTYSWVTDRGTITGSGATAQLAALDGPATARVTLTVSDGTDEVVATRSITIVNLAPSVQIVTPVSGARFPTGTNVHLDTLVADVAGSADPVGCVVNWGDGTSGSACDATHTYAVAGSFTIVVTANDGDGGTSTAMRAIVVEAPQVPECRFEGFYSPVDNVPTINTVKAGSNIPLKFKFCSDGRLAIFSNGSPTSSAHTCGGGVTDAVEETSLPGADTLKFDAATQQYHYNWKTEKSWSGQCRTLTFKLIDGTVVTAEFKFK